MDQLMNKIRIFLALGAFFVLAAALSACGGSDNVPGNAVAKVGDNAITKAQFNHWLQVAAISSQGQQNPAGTKTKPQIPQPPAFTACIAEKKKSAPAPAKGQPEPTTAQ